MPDPSSSSVSIELEHRFEADDSIQLLQPPQTVEDTWSASGTSTPTASFECARSESAISEISPNQPKPNIEEDERSRLLSADPVSTTVSTHSLVERISEVYTALPLSKERREIRVLDVNTNEDTPAVIAGTLRVIDLDHEPFFTALSYMWGDYAIPKDTIIISNNGCRFAVTKNCLSALGHLRKILGPVTIWIDAICINQNDDDEKAHQIALMSDVYSSAQTVYFWLGEGTKQTDKAMSYLARGALPFRAGIFNYVPQARLVDAKIPTGHSMSLRLGLHLYFRLLSGRIRPHYEGLDDILGRPWIRRMWTLQEAVLPRNAVIVCGDRIIPWLSMVYSLDFMGFLHEKPFTLAFPGSIREWRRLDSLWKDHIYLTDRNGYDELWKELRRHRKALRKGWAIFTALAITHIVLFAALLLFMMVSVISVYVYRNKHQTRLPRVIYVAVLGIVLLAILFFVPITALYITTLKKNYRVYPFTVGESLAVELQYRQATNAADKYFAILNFLDQPRPLPLSTPLETIYRILFERVISHSKTLDVLLLTPARMAGAPSWVVDWRNASPIWLRFRYRLEYRRLLPMLDTSWVHGQREIWRYRGAAPGELLGCKFRRGTQMLVQGNVISTLTWVSDLMEEFSAGIPTEDELLGSVEAFMTAMEGVEMYWRAMDHLADHAMEDNLPTDGQYHWERMMEKGIEMEDRRWVVGKLRKQAERAASWATRKVGTDAWRVHQAMTNFLAKERMRLVRCRGETLTDCGWAPEGAREGDMVALISGVPLPMILRKKDIKFYEVVGPAFFPGVMRGEVWELPELDDLENIVLV